MTEVASAPVRPVSPPADAPPVDVEYDTRAFGDFGWKFVNAGEQYRKLKNVSKEDALVMCGIFKQATMGDCLVDEPKRGDQEIKQRAEWLKHKGTDVIEAMQMYIDKVQEMAQKYDVMDDESEVAEEQTEAGANNK